MNSRINAQHTKRTQPSTSKTWIQELRRDLHNRAPSDFDVWFIDGLTEVAVGWLWTGEASNRDAGEIKAPTIDALLVQWTAIDWRLQRMVAKQALAGASL
jgi:hypothetical protein